ncbi:MAG: hypothetical protein D6798_01935, partial [Deltaproteobacteria bacterium]
PDLFADLLLPGESILATMAAGAAPRQDGARTWVTLGLTAQRLLAVVLVQAPHGGPWQPAARHAAPRTAVRLARFPRTPGAPARLEVHGLPEPLVLQDIDDPMVFPWLEPFLAAWGGPVDGAGNVRPREVQPVLDSGGGPDPRLLLAIVAGIVMFGFICCGCGGLISVLTRLAGAT